MKKPKLKLPPNIGDAKECRVCHKPPRQCCYTEARIKNSDFICRECMGKRAAAAAKSKGKVAKIRKVTAKGQTRQGQTREAPAAI